jgi:hypothetical protein
MKKLLAVFALSLLAVACGRKEAAAPLDVLPDSAMMTMAISDPAAMITNLDKYIETGVPAAGQGLVTNLILNRAGAENLDSLAAWLGLDLHGTVVLYATSMNPQAIGAAASAPDPEAFWTRTTEWGMEWTDAEPIGDAVVKTAVAGQGMTLSAAAYRGLILVAGARTELSAMIDRVEGRVPHGTVALEPGTFWMNMDVKVFGPMVASQIAMYRPEIMSGIEAGGTTPAVAGPVMDLYFDAFDLLLRETDTMQFSITFGPEDVKSAYDIKFIAGSSLDGAINPVEATDLTALLPPAGVMSGRMSIPPELTTAAMTAMLSALSIESDPAMIAYTAALSRNTAMAWYNDDPANPMHIVAAYELPEGTGMADVGTWIQASLDMASGMIGEMPGMAFTAPVDSVVGGVTYTYYSTIIDTAAMEQAAQTDSQPMPTIQFSVWLAEKDGRLLLEMAPTPVLLPGILTGTASSEANEASTYVASMGLDKEFVFAMDIAAYMTGIMSWAAVMGDSGADLSALASSEPVWVYTVSDITDAGLSSTCSFSGTEAAGYIGTMISAMGASGGF